MASGKFDQRYDFRSSDSRSTDTFRQRQRQGTAARPATAPPPRPEPPQAPESGRQPPVAVSLVAPPQRSEPDEDGKRDCMRGDWCSAYEIVIVDGKGVRRPAKGYQPFCPKDRRVLESDLAQLPAQFVYLAAEIGNPARTGQAVRVPFGPRIPIRIDVDTLMRAIEECLSSWHERIADVDSLSYPTVNLSRLQRQMVAVRNAGRVLAPRVDALLALDAQPVSRTRKIVTERDPKGRSTEDIRENVLLDGADAGMEIFTLRYLCRAVLGETKARPEELLGVPCRREECDQLALRRAELPSDPEAPVWWSECSACGDRLTEEEYRDWTRRYAKWAEAQQKTPATLENLPGVA